MSGSAVETTERIRSLASRAVEEISRAKDLPELEQLRIKYMARSGEVTLLTRDIGKAAPEDRSAIGAAVNEAKTSVQGALDAKKSELESSAGPARSKDAIDVTLPGTRRPVGRRHPL